jgi:hypothetical protein
VPGRSPILRTQAVDERVRRFEAGEPLKAIGEAAGCSRSTALNTIERLGHERRLFWTAG